MQFQDDLAAGVTLVRPALQSPDYVTGVSGWAVKIDGSAEFNNITIRGGTTVGGRALYYNGTPALGNLLLSISATAGTDAFGNTVVQGLGIYSTEGVIQAVDSSITVSGDNGSAVNILTGSASSQATIDLIPRDTVGASWLSASLYTVLGASDRPMLVLSSPAEDSNTQSSSIDLYGGGPTTSDTAILFSADRFSFGGITQLFGVIDVYDDDNVNAWTPALTGGGAATLSTADGWWQRVGMFYYVYAYMVIGTAGTGATAVTMNLPVTPWRGTANRRQFIPATVTGSSPDGPVSAVIFAGGTGATINRLQMSDGGDVVGTDLASGSIWIVEGWVRAA